YAPLEECETARNILPIYVTVNSLFCLYECGHTSGYQHPEVYGTTREIQRWAANPGWGGTSGTCGKLINWTSCHPYGGASRSPDRHYNSDPRIDRWSSCRSFPSCPCDYFLLPNLVAFVSLDGDFADHAVVAVIGDEARVFERSCLRELP